MILSNLKHVGIMILEILAVALIISSILIPMRKWEEYIYDTYPLVIRHVPLALTDQTLNEWNAFEALLETTPYKNIIVDWSGIGGASVIGMSVIHSINIAHQYHKIITFNVIGEAGSMHAYIACYADRVNLLPGSYMIFHAPYYRDAQGNKVKTYVLDEENFVFFQEIIPNCIKHGLMTLDNYKNMLEKDSKIIVSNLHPLTTTPESQDN